MAVTAEVIPDDTIRVLDHGFVRLDDAMADDLSVVNGARVSFARRKEEMDESDEGLIRFLMRERHGTPFEHNAFRFHVRCPIFVAREWFRHRVGCLTGDTVVTFVDCNGVSSPRSRKTIDQLWRMWTVGEANGHALSPEQRVEVDRLGAEGLSVRAIARRLGVGRRGVTSHLRGENQHRDGRWRLRKMRLRVLNEETGAFEVGHVADVIDKGVQPVYRVRLEDGTHLDCTENHRLLTSDGWKTMRAALGLSGSGASAAMTVECRLMSNGAVAYRDYDWMRARRREGKSVAEIAREAGCSYHTVRKWLAVHDLQFTREDRCGREPWNRGVSGYRTSLKVTDEHRAAIRRARSGPNSNFWRGGISSRRASLARWTTEQAPKIHAQFDYTCQRCGKRGGRLHAHHIVPVWLDESLAQEHGNLISICDRCHSAVHATRKMELEAVEQLGGLHGFARDVDVPRRLGQRLVAHPVRVVAVEYLGLRQTYDLTVDGPWHNFVANGVVVHNSFNEFSMRYARASDEFYVPAAEDVRTQVGKPGSYSFEPVSEELAEVTREKLQAVYETAYLAYEQLVELGVAREVARAALPVGAYTEFYWTVNARSLMNFVSLRNSETAQREIRRYAEACERFLEDKMPVTYAAFVANERTAP
ncbi:MAG TPA: FAD-dependent thymidylate synthase [Gaiellaceae bacterium]